VAVKALKLAVKYDLRTLLFCEAPYTVISIQGDLVSITFRYHGVPFKLKSPILAGFNSPLGMDIRNLYSNDSK
jgi:hypothetical protein